MSKKNPENDSLKKILNDPFNSLTQKREYCWLVLNNGDHLFKKLPKVRK